MEVTKVLIEHGSQVGPVYSDGCTPLHKAAERGYAETCQLLVSAALHQNSLNVCSSYILKVVKKYGNQGDWLLTLTRQYTLKWITIKRF